MPTNPGSADIQAVLERLRTLSMKDAISIRSEILEIVDEMDELLVAKGGDYSSIFEHEFGAPVVASRIRGDSVHGFFCTMIALKCARSINTSLSLEDPKFENLIGTWGDLLNYMILWLAYTRYQEGVDALRSNSSNQSAEQL